MKTALVIGAGLSGLLTARRLRDAGLKVIVVEKSRGVGGRMATRRDGLARYDHGAQFLSVENNKIPDWARSALTAEWIEIGNKSYYAVEAGMTNLAKELAVSTEIRFEHLVLGLKQVAGEWSAEIQNQAPIKADLVYMSCPLPQSLHVLTTSGVHYPSKLDGLIYAKALVGLFEMAPGPFDSSWATLQLDPTPTIAMIANQQSKRVSAVPAVTFTMAPDWSEAHFDLDEVEQLRLMNREIETWRQTSPAPFIFQPVKSQVKKWRFSHPLPGQQITKDLYVDLERGLFLIGDAFGGGSLHGAARSAFHVPIPNI